MNRTKLMLVISLFGVFLLMALPVHAEGGIRPTLTVNQEDITVGDPVELTLEVKHPANQQVIIPKLDQSWGEFEVQKQSSPETIIKNDGTAITSQKITVTLFQPGEFETPPLPLTISGDNGETSEIVAQPVKVSVVSVLADGDTALKDIRPQASMKVPFPWPLLATGLVVAVLAIGSGWWLVRRWRRNGSLFIDNRLPYQVALDELDRIRRLRLPDNGKFKEHYSLVTDTLRIYLEQQHHVPATDRTTSELKQELAYTRINPEQTRMVINLFGDADFVKFAKLIPDRDEAYSLLEDARQFVSATHPQPEPTDNEHRPKSVTTATPLEVSR
jgi:hypothetical protein